eukprot:CAMPEP_0173099246 /NCGR_PEP_ID=MMETSP1102-20130122/35365_1 /TAXON_ID=49646 /ORGANISM="Geminigera sp., Strain Caron Lab Isolate" /LENGTH=176 /DNA_ID=CAMNT_0013992203 /DNA_START=153 /DNA_END=683 /DNA_ORIENTATION=-
MAESTKRSAVAAGQSTTVGWSHYMEAPRSEYGSELPANGNSWAQLGHGSRGNTFTGYGQAAAHFEEPFHDQFGTDSSFMNKGDSEGVTMKAPTRMLAKAKKPYFHGMRTIHKIPRQKLLLKPVMLPHTNKLHNNKSTKKPYFHGMHKTKIAHTLVAKAALPVLHTPVKRVGLGFKF